VRGGPGGHDVARRDESLTVDLQRLLVDEAGVAVADREAVGVGDVSVLGPPQPVDQLLLLRHQGGQVHGPRAGRHHWEGAVVSRPVPVPGGGEQVLARHAADVEAGPAERAVLDQQRAPAARTCLDARGEGRPAAADDYQVVGLAHGGCCPITQV